MAGKEVFGLIIKEIDKLKGKLEKLENSKLPQSFANIKEQISDFESERKQASGEIADLQYRIESLDKQSSEIANLKKEIDNISKILSKTSGSLICCLYSLKNLG